MKWKMDESRKNIIENNHKYESTIDTRQTNKQTTRANKKSIDCIFDNIDKETTAKMCVVIAHKEATSAKKTKAAFQC